MNPVPPDVSVVIPLFNEEENVAPLITELNLVLARLNRPFEILCIDDGSSDHTFQELKKVQLSIPILRLIKFHHNAGQTAAFAAGFRHAHAPWVITLDGDLQNDPADIPHLLSHTPEFDVVIGVRAHRRDNLVRRLSSRIANAIRNFLTREDIVDTGCSLKVFRRSLLLEIPLFEGMHRFFPTLCKMVGGRVRQISVNHRERLHGRSKYNVFNRLFKSLKDCLAVRWMQTRAIRYRIEPEASDIP